MKLTSLLIACKIMFLCFSSAVYAITNFQMFCIKKMSGILKFHQKSIILQPFRVISYWTQGSDNIARVKYNLQKRQKNGLD